MNLSQNYFQTTDSELKYECGTSVNLHICEVSIATKVKSQLAELGIIETYYLL